MTDNVLVLDPTIDNTGAVDATSKINALISGGHLDLYFPRGTYKLSGSGIALNISDISIYGQNMRSTFFKHSQATGNCLTISGSSYKSYLKDFTMLRDVPATAGGNGIGYSGDVPQSDSYWEQLYAQDQWDGFHLPPAYSAWINACMATDNYNNGWTIENTIGYNHPLQYIFTNNLSNKNNNLGYSVTSNLTVFCPVFQWSNNSSFANTNGGMLVQAPTGSSSILS